MLNCAAEKSAFVLIYELGSRRRVPRPFWHCLAYHASRPVISGKTRNSWRVLLCWKNFDGIPWHFLFQQRHNHSTHGTPIASQKRKPIEIQPTSKTGTDYSSSLPGGNGESKNNSAQRSSRLKSVEQDEEEYTKLLRRRMISEVLQKKQPAQDSSVWQTPTRRDPKRRPQQRRSQSAQGRKNETQSEVNLPAQPSSRSSPQKGLGRRSVTQLELSRRKKTDENQGSSDHMQKAKWHSQENLDKVSHFCLHFWRSFEPLFLGALKRVQHVFSSPCFWLLVESLPLKIISQRIGKLLYFIHIFLGTKGNWMNVMPCFFGHRIILRFFFKCQAQRQSSLREE